MILSKHSKARISFAAYCLLLFEGQYIVCSTCFCKPGINKTKTKNTKHANKCFLMKLNTLTKMLAMCGFFFMALPLRI